MWLPLDQSDINDLMLLMNAKYQTLLGFSVPKMNHEATVFVVGQLITLFFIFPILTYFSRTIYILK